MNQPNTPAQHPAWTTEECVQRMEAVEVELDRLRHEWIGLRNRVLGRGGYSEEIADPMLCDDYCNARIEAAAHHRAWRTQLAEARAEAEALRVDAMRYRWLKGPADPDVSVCWWHAGGEYWYMDKDPDAAIDAAMKQTTKS